MLCVNFRAHLPYSGLRSAPLASAGLLGGFVLIVCHVGNGMAVDADYSVVVSEMSVRLVGLLGLVVLVLTACSAGSGGLRGYSDVKSALESAGLRVTELPDSSPMGTALMATECRLADVEQAKIHVCSFPKDVVVTTPDGYIFTATKAGSGTSTAIDFEWAGKPEVFQKNNVLVVFATRDANLASRILSAVKNL